MNRAKEKKKSETASRHCPQQKSEPRKNNKNIYKTWGRFHQHAYEKLFICADPKSVKIQSSHQYLFALWVLHM